jgi:4-carboxymuconolactone decarboxylase
MAKVKSPQARTKQPKARIKHPSRQPAERLPILTAEKLTTEQQALAAAIGSGPRGGFTMGGPFAVYLHAPAFGQLAQQLGAHVRYGTSVPPRLSEFAILCTAHYWKAQYEWHAHEPIAERQGVKAATIRALKAGRTPTTAPRDELAIYAFVKELYATRRVSQPVFARVHKLLGDAGTVELIGILGYYAMVAMTLNVFRMPVPEGTLVPFAEPKQK